MHRDALSKTQLWELWSKLYISSTNTTKITRKIKRNGRVYLLIKRDIKDINQSHCMDFLNPDSYKKQKKKGKKEGSI